MVRKSLESRGGYSLKRITKWLGVFSDLSVTFKKIKKLQSCHISLVYYWFSKLQGEGYITRNRELTSMGRNLLEKSLCGIKRLKKDYKPVVKSLRMHKIQYSVRILGKSKGFLERGAAVISHEIKDYKTWRLRSGGLIEQFSIDNMRIRATRNKIIIYQGEIYAHTIEDAIGISMDLLFRVIPKIENRLNIILVKDGYVNIAVTSQHFADMNNALADYLDKRGLGSRFIIKDDKDGKIRFIVDLSKGIPEFETTHYLHAADDIERAKILFDDWLKSEEQIKISDLKALITGITMLQKNQALIMQKIIKKLDNGGE